MGTDTAPLIISRREGSASVITLNRPRAINALNLEMFEGLAAALEHAERDGSELILLEGAGERGFCGGGDIKQMAADGASRAVDILRLEYEVDARIAEADVPVVGFMDGVTMGGGIGLAGHASHRVVTERSVLAMPETRIGIAPDVGGHLLLAQAPQRLGEYLAITSGTMTGADAIALGFADVFVPSERVPELRAALISGVHPAQAIAACEATAPASELLQEATWFAPLAESALGDAPLADDPAAAAARLVAALDLAAADDPRAAAVLDVVRAVCPTSVAVTLSQIDRTRRLGLTLREVLADDLRILSRLTARPDFIEGVRAQLIDKDRNPRWSPASIAELRADELEQILAPHAAGDRPLWS